MGLPRKILNGFSSLLGSLRGVPSKNQAPGLHLALPVSPSQTLWLQLQLQGDLSLTTAPLKNQKDHSYLLFWAKVVPEGGSWRQTACAGVYQPPQEQKEA